VLGQSPQATMLEDPNVPRAFVHDRGDLGHGEPAKDPEQDHFGLISRQQGANLRDGGVGSENVESGDGRVVVRGRLAQGFRRYRHIAACLAPPPVDESVPGNREHPRTELPVVATETREMSSGCEPSVSRDIFRCHRIESPQEPQQPWVQILPEHGDRPPCTILGGSEHLAELGRGR
jgi:hypothetical protein